MSETEGPSRPPTDIIRFVITTGWCLLVVVGLVTILAAVYAAFTMPKVPDDLAKLAFASTGFLFGSFPSLLKDLLFGQK